MSGFPYRAYWITYILDYAVPVPTPVLVTGCPFMNRQKLTVIPITYRHEGKSIDGHCLLDQLVGAE